MNIKTVAIRIAVSALAEYGIIRKTDPFSSSIFHAFGLETEEDRVARRIEFLSNEAAEKAKQMNTNRKFKKITKNV